MAAATRWSVIAGRRAGSRTRLLPNPPPEMSTKEMVSQVLLVQE